jgi:hypothetical protein
MQAPPSGWGFGMLVILVTKVYTGACMFQSMEAEDCVSGGGDDQWNARRLCAARFR